MASQKEPPDKYRCLKLPIISILFSNKEKEEEVDENMKILQKAIVRTNSITSKAYFPLLRGRMTKFLFFIENLSHFSFWSV